MSKSINPLMRVLETKAHAYDTIAHTVKKIPNDQDLGEWIRKYIQSVKLEETKGTNKNLLFD